MNRQTIEWQVEDYLRILRLHWVLVVGITLLCTGGGTVRLLQKPNLYKATAKILIETQAPQLVQFRELNPWSGMFQQFVMTEMKIMAGRSIAERVLEELNLAAFPPFSKAQDPVARLQGMIAVDQIRGTKLVEICATSTKPELAARLANGVASAYTQMNLERRQKLTTGGAQWLRDEVGRAEQRMKAAQLALQKFKEEHRDLPVEDAQSTVMQRLEQLSTAITDTRKQRIEAETKYREKHPILLELQAKETELETVLQEQEGLVLEVNRLSVEYNNLRRDAQSNEAIYNTLLTRMKELSVQEGLQTNNVQLIEEALIPRKPFSPNRQRGILLSTLIGLFLGCGLAFARETLSKTIRTRSQFENLLQIPFLGHVPLTGATRSLRSPHQRLLLLNDPKSNASEAIRAVRTTIEFLLPVGQPQVLLVTSSLPEEGKSMFSLNLAIAFQELGRKVLMVDADLRRPTLHQSLQINLEPGLSTYLQEQVEASELVQIISHARDLPVVTAGLTPPQPADLLISPRLRSLFETWKKEYQYILLDTPPVLAVADTTALAGLVDGVIYVLRADRSHRDVVLAGKQRLVDVGAKIIGGILNATRMELERGYHYNYYYQKREGTRKASRRVRPAQEEKPEEMPAPTGPAA